MKTRLIQIKGCKTAKEVLVTQTMLEQRPAIEISCWHETAKGSVFQQEYIDVNDPVIAGHIVADFSHTSALAFANRQFN